MRDSTGISIFAQGDGTCAVCAPGGTMRQLVIDRVEAMNPTASGHPGWKVFAGKLPDGGLNPRPCPHDGARHHWLLVRSAAARSAPGLRHAPARPEARETHRPVSSGSSATS